jgi:GAF domain-containing protein/HAMP domain-containing protein
MALAKRPAGKQEEASMSDQAAPHIPTQPDQSHHSHQRISITRGIGRTLLVSFLALTLIPLIVAGVVATSLNALTAQDSARERLATVADLKVQAIRDWLNERENNLEFILLNQSTSDLVQVLLREPTVESFRRALTDRLAQQTRSERGLERFIVLDNAKRSIASTDPALLGQDNSNRPYAFPMTDQPLIALYYDDVLGTNQVAIAQTVFDQDRQPIGVVVGMADADRLTQIVTAGKAVGATAENYLVGARGYGFLTPPRFEAHTASVATVGVINALNNRANGEDTYNNYNNVPVLGAYRFIPGLNAALLSEQALSEAYSAVRLQAALSTVAILIAAVGSIIGAYFVTRRIVRPINNLTEVAVNVTAGDLNQVASVERKDQIGVLAASFNTMTARLRDTIDSLETRVEMRTAQVQASADVGRVVTSILDPDQLLKQVVQLISERFGFYYAAAFTLDAAGQWAVLREATGPGDAAWLLKQAGHRLEISGNSMVGASIRERKARIALDVGAEAVRFSNPLLPDTRSEVTLPLIVGDKVLGALNVQSTQPAAFDETSTAVLQNMADQIAVALNNAAQYQQEQQRAQQTTQLLEASVELGSQTKAASLYTRIVEVAAHLLHADSAALWQPVEETEIELVCAAGFLKTQTGRRAQIGEGIAGRVHATSLALRLNDARTWHDAAIDFGEVQVQAVIAVPLLWQGQPIGVLVIAQTNHDSVFTADDGNVAQLYASQTASTLANMRLLEQLQRTLDDLGVANRRLTGEAWQSRLRGSEISYEYLRTKNAAGPREKANDQTTVSLALPIELRGQPIGQIVLEDDRPQRTLTEDEQSIVQEVTQRMSLALESARLFEQTQAALGEARRLAQREQLVNRITGELRAATTVVEVLRIATDEMRHAVRASWAAADLRLPEASDNGRGNNHDSQS